MGRLKVLIVALALACPVVASAATDGQVSAQTVDGSGGTALTAEERERFVEGARRVAGLGDEEIERVLRNPEMIDDIPVSRGPVTAVVRRAGSGAVTSRTTADETKRKVMTIPYEDANGETVLKLVVTKTWTFGGGRVTYGDMSAVPWVREDARYSTEAGGWRYAQWAQYGTEKFVNWDGRDQGAHKSTLAGLFEFVLPGADAPSGWVSMGAVQIGRYNGACDSTNYLPKNPQWTSRPRVFTTESTATFGFSLEPGAVFKCGRDGTTPASCSSPKTYSSLPEGEHKFRLEATDAAGKAALRPPLYEWTIDLTPPRVVSIEPAAGAADVPAEAAVEAVFSEDVEAISLLNRVTLSRFGTGEPVEGFVGYDPSTRRVTFTPDAPLAAGETYTARIKGGEHGVKDRARNPLGQDKAWNFTVAP